MHEPCGGDLSQERGGGTTLICGAIDHAVQYGKREALEEAVQAGSRLRAAAAEWRETQIGQS